MENEPRNYEEPPIKLLLERFGKWYIAKWYNPLIPVGIIFLVSLAILEITKSKDDIAIILELILEFFLFLAFIAAVFTSLVHFLLEKRWKDFCLLFLACIFLLSAFYLFVIWLISRALP